MGAVGLSHRPAHPPLIFADGEEMCTLRSDRSEDAREKRSRSSRARIGAYALHAKYDSQELTKNARATFLARFEREVDPDGTLPAEDRARRAKAARSAYFRKLALASARKRAKR